MSLPVSPLTILGAARTARDVAGAVANSLVKGTASLAPGSDFGAVLREGAESAADLLQQTADAIRQRLAAAGLSANLPLEFSVHDGGKIRLTNPHDLPESAAERAAEIESLLASDPHLKRLAARLHTADGETNLTVGGDSKHADGGPEQPAPAADLTKSGIQANMSGLPGGYANW